MFKVLLFLLSVVASYHVQVKPQMFNGLGIIYKGILLSEPTDSIGFVSNSRISLNIDAKKITGTSSGQIGYVDVVIASESIVNSMGYRDASNEQVLCCDSKAVSQGLCKYIGHILLPEENKIEYTSGAIQLKNAVNSVELSFESPSSGVYYIVVASCSVDNGETEISGEYTVVGPYGHLPATLQGSLPFNILLTIVYVVCVCVWVGMCAICQWQISLVHYIILASLAFSTLTSFSHSLYLHFFNRSGTPSLTLSLITSLVTAVSRCVVRVTTMAVTQCTMTTESLTHSLTSFNIHSLSLSLFLAVSLWDCVSQYFPRFRSPTADFNRLIISSGVEAIIFFIIYHSLTHSIDSLTLQKQYQKLSVFNILRGVFFAALGCACIVLISFSSLIVFQKSLSVWKYQWIANEGIWQILNLFIIATIMVLWKPSSYLYSGHIEVATDDTSAAMLPAPALEAGDESERIVVSEVSETMKPMTLSE